MRLPNGKIFMMRPDSHECPVARHGKQYRVKDSQEAYKASVQCCQAMPANVASGFCHQGSLVAALLNHDQLCRSADQGGGRACCHCNSNLASLTAVFACDTFQCDFIEPVCPKLNCCDGCYAASIDLQKTVVFLCVLSCVDIDRSKHTCMHALSPFGRAQ